MHQWYHLVCVIMEHWSVALVALATEFEQVIVLVILTIALFADWITICSMSGANKPLVLPCLHNPIALSPDFEKAFASVICSLCFLLTRY